MCFIDLGKQNLAMADNANKFPSVEWILCATGICELPGLIQSNQREINYSRAGSIIII
jgi:hypothetical protein